MNIEPNKPAEELSEKELDAVTGGANGPGGASQGSEYGGDL